METIEVSTSGFALALSTAMKEARINERMLIAKEVQNMIHDELPGGYIVLLRKVRDEILGELND